VVRCVEAFYTDAIGRELFRELLADAGYGLPTAVRHRDGSGYVLAAETGYRAVYRKATGPAACWLRCDRRTAPATLQGYRAN
jgi:hypothetical protein